MALDNLLCFTIHKEIRLLWQGNIVIYGLLIDKLSDKLSKKLSSEIIVKIEDVLMESDFS